MMTSDMSRQEQSGGTLATCNPQIIPAGIDKATPVNEGTDLLPRLKGTAITR